MKKRKLLVTLGKIARPIEEARRTMTKEVRPRLARRLVEPAKGRNVMSVVFVRFLT